LDELRERTSKLRLVVGERAQGETKTAMDWEILDEITTSLELIDHALEAIHSVAKAISSAP
jgi:hypothetical protein